MNRIVIFGVALFLAVVGLALLGGENAALAGHGFHGCAGCHGVDNGCCGMKWKGCHGGCAGCAGHGDGIPVEVESGADDVPEAPPEAPPEATTDAGFDRAPTAFRTVSFRR